MERIIVGVDVGCRKHRVAIGTPDGRIAEEFDVSHEKDGFDRFFRRLDFYRSSLGVPVVVAMEGCNGYASPLDRQVQDQGYTLLNVNNLKLNRFKEIFPSPAKTDAIDARKIVELARLQPLLPQAKNVLQEVHEIPESHRILKRLTRRRRELVDAKKRVMNRMQKDLQAVSPGLSDLVECKDGTIFLRFLTSRPDLRQLGRMRREGLLKIRGLGEKFADKVQAWQKRASFSREVDYVGPMIIEDAQEILRLKERVKILEEQIEGLTAESDLSQTIGSIPGFGLTCTAELTAEIGTIDRFENERSLAFYLGMAPLDRCSGGSVAVRPSKHVNTRAKAALMTAVAHHVRHVEQSARYYRKKRDEGKRHNQAIRSLARHLIRVLWSMIKKGRLYEITDGRQLTEKDL